MVKARVNKIIENTFIDGPGSRYAIFLQECNLRCLYCHNPETQNLCSSCGQCVKYCPSGALKVDKKSNSVIWNKDICTGCDTCIKICNKNASPKITYMSSNEIFDRIKKIEVFLDGITVSGGECTLQNDFMYDLFKKVKENTSLTNFVDTNGTLSGEPLEKLSTVSDGFMFDLKCFDEKKHIKLTGHTNKDIIKNMQYVSNLGLLYEVRTVIVEGFTDIEDEIENISRLIKDMNGYTRLKLIPFRPFGVKGILSSKQQFNGQRFNVLYRKAKETLKDRVVF